MPTNAQAALAAAATVFSGGRGHTTPASVKLLAESFKGWLDHHDPPAAPEPRESQLDALVIPAEPHGEPELIAGQRPDPVYPGLRIGFAPRS
jgi:hypothetical protein